MPRTILNSKEKADVARDKILRAAVQEFSAHGLSGARTDAIAEAAGVNKALLYYYFQNKEGLYAAAIEQVASRVVASALEALDPRHSAGERMLRFALNHFDRLLTQREFQRLMHQEMVRFHQGDGGTVPPLFRRAFEPVMEKLQQGIEEGIRRGELCEVDWLQVLYSIIGANVFYFLSAPMLQLALPFRLFDKSVLESRRRAIAGFLGSALFVDRAYGARLARRVLREMPLPRIRKFELWTKGSGDLAG